MCSLSSKGSFLGRDRPCRVSEVMKKRMRKVLRDRERRWLRGFRHG